MRRSECAGSARGDRHSPGRKNLQYAARYDETAVFSSDQTNWQTATTSGSLNYMNTNERHPFTAQYTGGYTWTLTGRTTNPDSFTNFF